MTNEEWVAEQFRRDVLQWIMEERLVVQIRAREIDPKALVRITVT